MILGIVGTVCPCAMLNGDALAFRHWRLRLAYIRMRAVEHDEVYLYDAADSSSRNSQFPRRPRHVMPYGLAEQLRFLQSAAAYVKHFCDTLDTYTCSDHSELLNKVRTKHIEVVYSRSFSLSSVCLAGLYSRVVLGFISAAHNNENPALALHDTTHYQ